MTGQMNLTEAQAPFRRGRILAVLAHSNDAGCNTPLLRDMIRQWGYRYDADTMAIDLAWLARHGLITLREIAGVDLARITGRGADVVSRDLDLPGIAFASGA